MRIYAQQSAFTVHNSTRKLEQLNCPGLLNKIIIPASKKQDIRRQLELCGISLRSIYPDAQHIAQELKDFYK